MHEQDGQCIKMAVAQHDSFLPSREYSVKREVKESGRPPPFHIASLLSTSPPPEKSDESCADTVHHKPVPGPSGSGEVLGGTVDYSYGCQCGDAGKPHSARCASCGVSFRTAVITDLPVCSSNTSTCFFQFSRPVMQLCVLPTGRFSHSSCSAAFLHPCSSCLLSSFHLSRSLPVSK